MEIFCQTNASLTAKSRKNDILRHFPTVFMWKSLWKMWKNQNRDSAFYAEKYANMHDIPLYFPTFSQNHQCTIYSTVCFPHCYSQGVEKSHFQTKVQSIRSILLMYNLNVPTTNSGHLFLMCGICKSFITVDTEMMPSAIATAIPRVMFP